MNMFRQERALFCLLVVGELKLEVILLIPDNLYLEEVKNLIFIGGLSIFNGLSADAIFSPSRQEF